MGSGTDRSERIGRNFPALLPDGFLYRRNHCFGHLNDIAHKRLPLLRIRRPLAGRFDFRIKRRFLRASGWYVSPVLGD